MRKLATFVLLLTICASQSGCTSWMKNFWNEYGFPGSPIRYYDAVFDFQRSDRIAIVRFQNDADPSDAYGLGSLIPRNMTQLLLQRTFRTFTYYDFVPMAETDLGEPDFAKIKAATNADYLVFGQITEFSDNYGNVVNIRKARITVKLTIWNLNRGAVAYEKSMFAEYPERDQYAPRQLISQDGGTNVLECVKTLVDGLAKLFYDHKVNIKAPPPNIRLN